MERLGGGVSGTRHRCPSMIVSVVVIGQGEDESLKRRVRWRDYYFILFYFVIKG